MRETVRVLYVDDSCLDRDLVRDALVRDHGRFTLTEAESRKELEQRLAEGSYDLLITDFNILGFDGLQVVDLVRTQTPGLPVIILTGTGSEEIAVDAMRRGVDDYVIKTRDHIRRLPQTILSVMERKRIEKERETAIDALRLGQERLDLALEAGELGLWDWNANTDEVYYDERWGSMLGYSPEELEPHLGAWERLVHPEDKAGVLERVDEHVKGLTSRFQAEQRLKTKSGEWRWILVLGRVIERNQDGTAARILGTHLDITERKKAEEALIASEKRLIDSQRIAGIGDFIWNVDTGEVTWSDAMFDLLQYDKSEYIDYAKVNAEIHHPDDLERITEWLKDCVASSKTEPAPNEYRLIRKDGKHIYVRTAVVIKREEGRPTQVFGTVHDITERKLAEDSLKASEEKYRAVVDNLQVGISVINPKMEIIATNKFFQQYYPHVRPGDGQLCYEMYNDPPIPSPCSYCPCVQTFHDGMVHESVTETPVGGRIRNYRLVSCPIKDEQGNVDLVIELVEDITERRTLQAQLAQAQKMEAVGTLAGGVAHDFNNILQVALGYSELILGDEELPQRFRGDVKKINDSARRGADLVQRLLTFSRKMEIKPRPLSLNRRITEMRKMIERTIPKMIDIQLVLAEELEAINADPTHIDQVIMNLAVNARDAMPEGGKLIVETANVILDEESAKTHLDSKPGRFVLLTVTDTGTGMDKDTLEHILEPFYTTKGVGEGTGLGLAMVDGIVKQHGGHIRCYSEPGTGTTFKIYFPALVSSEEVEQTKVWPMPRGGSETILLVDDEELIRDLGSRILTKAGYKVIPASSGKEALDVHERLGGEIALVVLDLIMPEMGGRQCLEGLLSRDPSVKVVIASGYSADGPTNEALNSGAKGFVNKPYDIRQMLEVVRGVLDAE